MIPPRTIGSLGLSRYCLRTDLAAASAAANTCCNPAGPRFPKTWKSWLEVSSSCAVGDTIFHRSRALLIRFSINSLWLAFEAHDLAITLSSWLSRCPPSKVAPSSIHWVIFSISSGLSAARPPAGILCPACPKSFLTSKLSGPFFGSIAGPAKLVKFNPPEGRLPP